MTSATRYLLRRLVLPFVVALFIFTGVLMLMELFRLTDLVVNKGVPLYTLLLLLLTRIPQTFSITVPMALVMAVIMTFSRMADDNELISLRMAGYPLHRMLVPPLVVGLMLAVSLVAIKEYGLPQLSEFKQKTLSRMQLINPAGKMKPRTYLEIPPYTLYADRVDGMVMKNVWIEDRSQRESRIIISRKGEWIRRDEDQFSLRLTDGSVHWKGTDNNYRIIKFDRQTLKLTPSLKLGDLGSGKTIDPLTERYQHYLQLGRELARTKESDRDYETRLRKYRQVATNFHRDLALPLATFFLVLVTAPTGLLTEKYGSISDLVFALGIFFCYYIVLTLAESLAETGYLAPAIALWSPNLIFGGFGLVLFLYLRHYGV